jgi:hypothetical protein
MLRESPTPTGILEAALDYTRQGLPIIPLNGKIPALCGWQQFVATPSICRFWFGAGSCHNIGLRTGESGYVVVDTDTAEAEDWVRAHLPATPLQAISGNGSTHRYYRTPTGAEIRNKQGWKGIPGLDVRGHGGYIVLPPSVHPQSGRRYEWLTAFRLPEGLPVFSPCWVAERRTVVLTAVAQVLGADEMLARGRRYVDTLPEAISHQGGHRSTFVAALKIVSFVQHDPILAWELLRYFNATKCLPPWREEPELRHKLDDALRLAR